MTTVIQDKKLNKIDDIFEFSSHDTFEDIHFKWDRETGLKAIIAIHNTHLGPAFGGCRFINYPTTDAAIIDALRLARGMSYKAAMANLPYGGGKSVIIKPQGMSDREAFFHAFGRFVDSLGGRYITAKDSGTTVADMDAIATQTRYVGSTSSMDDPSPATALGIKRGIEAAVLHKLKKTSLDGIHVAIQGAGYVGYYLAKYLHEAGARLTVCDIDEAAVNRCATEFKANRVAPNDIYQVQCDIFAPCALGAIINDDTIPQLKASIIAGAANNQLAQSRHGEELRARNILYVPDYVLNAGGLIHATYRYEQQALGAEVPKVLALYDVILHLLEEAESQNKPTSLVADEIAHAKLHSEN